MKLLWWSIRWSMWWSIRWSSVTIIVVMKNCFIDVLKMCWRCVEDVLKMCWMKREMNVEDVLKNCLRIVEDLYHNLHQACNVCMNFIRSFLKNNSMKMWSVILHIWNEVMNNPSLNMLWWSIYHLNFVIKSLWMFVMKIFEEQ